MFSRLGFACSLAFAAAAYAQTGAPSGMGAQTLTFRSSVDDSEQPYAIYVPKALSTGKKLPLVISLHSEDSSHRLNLRQVFGAPLRFGEMDPENMRLFPTVRDAGFVVACPLARGSMGYQGIPEKDVYDVLADVEKRYPIDPDAVYLTGISMGGGGALWLALTRPDIWAAAAPLAPAALPGTEDLAGNALHVPIRIFQGDLDPIVPAESSRQWQRRFLDFGVPADYMEYPGVRHNIWDVAYKNGAIFDWFAKFRRDRDPERVRFTTSAYRYASAYWVRIDGLTPGTLASIDATWVSNSALKVETKNLNGFTAQAGQRRSTSMTVTIDGTTLRVRAAPALSFVKTDGRWQIGRLQPQGKRPGAEGPIAEAVAGRQVYVYGSAGARTADELAARRNIAEAAASWSTPRSRQSLSFPVKADTEVTPDEIENANLILFGTVETNALIARFAPEFPMALSPGAADYGLVFVAPLGHHYALVNSGLPWWTGAEERRVAGPSFVPEQYKLLRSFGDYILFKGSLGKVVAEGRFDRNWKVPADSSAKMLATGTVTIRQK